MQLHFLLILFASVVFTITQSQELESPLEALCGRAKNEKCIAGGVLNGKILSVDLPANPQKPQETQIDGTVTVQLLFNEYGEVIFASPVSGPEELWAASIKAAVSTRFHPTKLSGKPIKVSGVLLVKNGKIDPPKPTRGSPTNYARPLRGTRWHTPRTVKNRNGQLLNGCP